MPPARWIVLAAVLAGCTRAARYVAPQLPVEQLALVTTDERATILSVDGLEPGIINEPATRRTVYVATGCRVVVVRYEATYKQHVRHDPTEHGAPVQQTYPLLIPLTHYYSTEKPIRFVVPAKPGATYWVTASFDGDQFLPRVAELDAGGQTTAHVEPDGKCP